MLNGSCLCGSVVFEIKGEVTDIYQCHCSVCRRAFSSAHASVFLCSGDDFRWVSGQDQIKLYQTDSGYRSSFCQACGSHLPDPNPDETTFWVPAGLIQEQDPGTKVGAHVYVGSRAKWDEIAGDAVQYEEGFTATAG